MTDFHYTLIYGNEKTGSKEIKIVDPNASNTFELKQSNVLNRANNNRISPFYLVN